MIHTQKLLGVLAIAMMSCTTIAYSAPEGFTQGMRHAQQASQYGDEFDTISGDTAPVTDAQKLKLCSLSSLAKTGFQQAHSAFFQCQSNGWNTFDEIKGCGQNAIIAEELAKKYGDYNQENCQ